MLAGGRFQSASEVSTSTRAAVSRPWTATGSMALAGLADCLILCRMLYMLLPGSCGCRPCNTLGLSMTS